MKPISIIRFLVIAIALCLHMPSEAQSVGINTLTPDPSAALDIASDAGKGLLIPRMNSSERNAIRTPANGLLVYDVTTNTFWYYKSDIWIEITSDLSRQSMAGVFENNGGVVRNTGSVDDDFVFGKAALPQNGETVSENLFFFDESKGAFRAGAMVGSNDWSPDNMGQNSTAFGRNTEASGDNAAALGSFTNAIGLSSTALGQNTTSSGDYSMATGHFSTASGYSSLASGFQTIASGNYATAFGVATNAIGSSSAALGSNSRAEGDYSTAMGYYTKANGTYSTAIGYWGEATGDYATAMGRETFATGSTSLATGDQSIASGEYSTAMGRQTEATGAQSTAMGFGSIASGTTATALGSAASATGIQSVSIGSNTDASGRYSTALGWSTLARAYGSTALGRCNVGLGNADGWVDTDPILEVGIGSPGSTKNALTILKKGYVGIGTMTPEAPLQVTSAGTSYIPQLQLTESIANQGSRIIFSNAVEASNRWTLYARSDNTHASSAFNLYYNGIGNIITATGNGYVGVKGNPTSDLHLFHSNNAGAGGLKLENSSNADWIRLYVASTDGFLRLYSKVNGSAIIGAFDDVTGAYTSLSDRRVKNDIQKLHFDWANFMQLEPLTYHFNADKEHRQNIGMIAQDVKKIYPELVKYMQDEDLYHMDYAGFGVIAVKAVQELKTELDTKDAFIKRLSETTQSQQKEIGALMDAVAELRAMIKSDKGK